MDQIRHHLTSIILCGALGGLFAASADAAGVSVDYSNITESSGTGDAPLYLTPATTGDTLNFDPAFSAFADGSGGNAAEMVNGRIGFNVQAISGNVINGLNFLERGNYNLLSFGNAALADVSATVFIEVLEVDGTALLSPVNEDAAMTFNPASDGQFQLSSFGVADGLWDGTVSLDLNTILSASGITYSNGVTKIHVEVDNTLLALAQTDSQAHISLQDLQITSTTSIVAIPEPASLLMLAGTGLVITCIRRIFIA